jgi:hypothetical protein
MTVSPPTSPLRSLQIEVTRLKEENRDLRAELSVLHSSIRALSALQDLIPSLTPSTDVLDLLGELLDSVLAVVGASDGSLLLVDEETKEMVFAVVHGEAKERLTGYRLAAGQGIAGWVASNRQPQIVQDVRHDPASRPPSTPRSTSNPLPGGVACSTESASWA